MGERPDHLSTHPAATPEEVAAIMAAMEALWPRPVAHVEDRAAPPAWRFSGRWWRKPVAARRDRPW